MHVELFEIGNGWGFQIVENGMVICYQPTDTTEGNEPMTHERATEFGNELLARLTHTPPVVADEA